MAGTTQTLMPGPKVTDCTKLADQNPRSQYILCNVTCGFRLFTLTCVM